MLARLSIRDIVLIDQLDLEFPRGLTILTGETGAGKSILLDALSLALGARGDGALVRHGQAQGQVTAVFELAAGHPSLKALEFAVDRLGGRIDPAARAIRGRPHPRFRQRSERQRPDLARARGRSGRDSRPARRTRAAGFARPTVRWSTPMAGWGRSPRRRRAAFAMLRAIEADLARERAEVAKMEAAADFARHAAEELTRLAVQPGEEDLLAERRQRMMQGEKVAADIRDAHESLAGDAAILPVLSAISRRLQRRMPQAPQLIEPSVQALDEAMEALEVATRSVEAALAACDFDPRELERCETRLFALRAMARKYAAPVEALPALAQKYAGELADLGAAHARVSELEQASRSAADAYAAAAAALSRARQASARNLERAVNAELPPLKLERASFSAPVESDAEIVAADGFDRVEFVVQTNPGSRPGPLMKVASGGELSRFLLALKVSLAERDTAPTLVFDEIDTGVGGAVADAIGQRLARLAAKAQVLAVTHAPQVAARSQRHFKITKDDVGAGERVVTRVIDLGAPERREEIARMLAGAEITREARAAAKSLIEKAG